MVQRRGPPPSLLSHSGWSATKYRFPTLSMQGRGGAGEQGPVACSGASQTRISGTTRAHRRFWYETATPQGGGRPFHQKSTCLTQLTSGPYDVTLRLKFRANETGEQGPAACSGAPVTRNLNVRDELNSCSQHQRFACWTVSAQTHQNGSKDFHLKVKARI